MATKKKTVEAVKSTNSPMVSMLRQAAGVEELTAIGNTDELVSNAMTVGEPTVVTIDSALSTTSTNPVQNKIVTAAINTNTANISSNTSAITDLSSALNATLNQAVEGLKQLYEHKVVRLPITWEQGVWGASGKQSLTTRIRSNVLFKFDEEITYNLINDGTGTVAYTYYSDEGETRVGAGYITDSITFDPAYYYGIWMQASNSSSSILPSAGDDITLYIIASKGIAVFIGDSYTSGVGLDDTDDRWSTKVCDSLGLEEYNYAVGGAGFYVGTSSETSYIYQLNNAVGDSSFHNEDVRFVFISGGRNDGGDSTAYNYSQSQVQSLVSALIDGAQTNFPNATIVLIPMFFDATLLPQYLFSWYQKIIISCRSFYRNIRIVKNAYKWLTGCFALIQNDAIHPNAAGHNIIATNVIDSLNGGTGANNMGEYSIAYNTNAINNNPAMGVMCDGEKVYLQSSLIRTITNISAGTALFEETFTATMIPGWTYAQKIYATIYNIENGESYSVYFTMSRTTTTYTAGLYANETIPTGRYSLYKEIDFGRYLNVVTGD